MHSAWLRSTFLRLLKFPHIKEGWLNFSGEPILQNVWIIWSPLLYFNLKSFLDPNSLSFIRFQWVLHNSRGIFLEFWNSYKLKRGGGLIFGWNQFCRKSEFGPRHLYFNFKSFKYRISLSFIRFQCIVHDSAVALSEFWSFYKFNWVDLISGRNQFCRMS